MMINVLEMVDGELKSVCREMTEEELKEFKEFKTNEESKE